MVEGVSDLEPAEVALITEDDLESEFGIENKWKRRRILAEMKQQFGV